MKELARELVARMDMLTVERSAEPALANESENRTLIQNSIADLVPADSNSGSAIVICAGPSLHKQDPAPMLREIEDRPTIVAVDAALGYCLRNELIPDYVVSLDPHRTRVCRWFGDHELGSAPSDDYFQRQELDPYVRSLEAQRNEELIALVDRHGREITALLATSAAPNVAGRCIESGMEIYWWNPILDDFMSPDSLTRRLYKANGLPAIATGGNVGSAAWVIAHQILKSDTVILVGMDFGYAPGTPLMNTQYFLELEEIFGDRAEEAFIEIRNPHTNEKWFTDPTYYWYRQSFLDMVRVAGCKTVNCSEGGTLYGEGIEFRSLRDQLGEPSIGTSRGQ